jgi:hypothetical protein
VHSDPGAHGTSIGASPADPEPAVIADRNPIDDAA